VPTGAEENQIFVALDFLAKNQNLKNKEMCQILRPIDKSVFKKAQACITIQRPTTVGQSAKIFLKDLNVSM
jgi:hypothetical protein